MALSGSEDTIGVDKRPSRPRNLTAAAEPLSWAQACRAIGVRGAEDPRSLDVHGLTDAENGQQNDGSHEFVYVVVAGFGVLHFADEQMECTGGDVLFVPRGCPHRFERLDGEIRIWRISSGPPA
jgi:mannose-6-phosphate isomerase-like protein (cupin superfamily)